MIVRSFSLAFGGLLIWFSSCSGPDDTHAGRSVFRYNESKGISTLDPAYARNQTVIWPVNQLFNGLVQMDDSLSVKPCIARSWDISGDGRVYTFHLRKDVFFHRHALFGSREKRRVMADDFLYSFSRITDPAVASPGAWIFNHLDRSGEHPEGFDVLNDSTFRIFIRDIFPPFAGLLTMPYCSVVPREAVEYFGSGFRSHPLGTGPFMFGNWREDEKLVLVRNPDYFEKDAHGRPLPYLDAVSITFIKDKQSEFLEFMLGNLDFLSGVHPVYKDELTTPSGNLNPKYAGRFRMYRQSYLNTEYLGFLVDEDAPAAAGSVLLDVRVRKAINYGFDRVRMMKYLRNNIGTPALAGFVPEGMPSFSDRAVQGYDYDPDRSRQLLREAGYPDGKGLPEITLTTTSDYRDLCEYIQHELSQVGIRISIGISTGAAFRNLVANSELPFFRGSWIADYPDAENYLSLFYSPNFSPAGPNYTHYRNPRYDSLFEQAVATPGRKERYRMYHILDQMIMNDAVVVPLYYDMAVRFVPINIRGMQGNPMNLLTLKRIRKNQVDGSLH